MDQKKRRNKSVSEIKRRPHHEKHTRSKLCGLRTDNLVTYSKNVFIPVTNICRNKCGYCGFKRRVESPEAHLMTEKEVVAILAAGAKAGCTEALFTFGEYPEQNSVYKTWLEDMGFETTVDYVCHLSKISLDMGILPHTNAGILTYEELKKIKPYNASLGLMLETTAPPKRIQAHSESPGKDPKVRLEMIENAGRLKIPFTTGLLIGIGENEQDHVQSLKAIAKLHKKYDHIQEVILQNYSPKPNAIGAEKLRPPTDADMKSVYHKAKSILPKDIEIQMPPNLMKTKILLKMGVRDLGGISPITDDFINPEASWPGIQTIEKEIKNMGLTLKERLPVYPKYVIRKWYGKQTEETVRKLAGEDGYRRLQ